MKAEMNGKQYQYVLCLAHERSFSRAAETLNITQPSLSQYIKRTEEELGASLFDRSGRDVRLTDAGRAYLEIGRKIFDLEHQLEGELSDLSLYKKGTISIGISAHRAVALMPPVAKAFHELYPGICLKIIERNRRELLEASEQGEFDLCITTLPVDVEIFHYETIFVEENVIAVPSTIRLDAEQQKDRLFPAISVSSLNRLSFVTLNEEHLMQRELEELAKSFHIAIKKTIVVTSLQALTEMVKEGIGAAFIPVCLAKKDSRVTYYSIQEVVPTREIVMMHRKHQYLSKAVIDLKQIIYEVLS